MALSAGTRLGPYEILEPLGAGGMGEVYRARNPRLNCEIALEFPFALSQALRRVGAWGKKPPAEGRPSQ